MNEENKKSNIVLIGAIIIFLLLAGIFLYFMIFRFKPTKTIEESLESNETTENKNILTKDEHEKILKMLQGNHEASDGMTYFTYTIEDETIRIVAASNGKAMVYFGTFDVHEGYITVFYDNGKETELSYDIEDGKITNIAPLPLLVQ